VGLPLTALVVGVVLIPLLDLLPPTVHSVLAFQRRILPARLEANGVLCFPDNPLLERTDCSLDDRHPPFTGSLQPLISMIRAPTPRHWAAYHRPRALPAHVRGTLPPVAEGNRSRRHPRTRLPRWPAGADDNDVR
jgi:hypothetical protein